MMKKMVILLNMFMTASFVVNYAANVSVNVGAKRYEKVKLVLVGIGDDRVLKECIQTIQKDFLFSGQFDVSVEQLERLPSKKSFSSWQKQGYLLAIFINLSEDRQVFEWRIYDTSKIGMLKGKTYKKRGQLVRGWAHNMADTLWFELMGHKSSFSSKVAYCKEIAGKGKYCYRHIYVADYDGMYPQPLITTPTVNVAPRWNRDINCPLLFYSESSQINISLRVTAMDGRRKIASNFDGLNMLPTFSKDGKKVVYCVSHGNGHCNLYFYEKGKLQQLSYNRGNNISPSLSDDGNQVFFCSDSSGIPLIYQYDRFTSELESITDSGPCFSPSYSEKNRKLAYIKRVDGVMQIFLYDLLTKGHTQFTTDTNYHKEECSWSPCGNYLLFCLTTGSSSRLVSEHLVTRERHWLTATNEHCSYPTWSPLYSYFPLVGGKEAND
ncbi:hypothetical protein E3J79_04230 [Candidatus Dependentiae bacterium]|nr:MAG: hypothetical protein E3J79_04230 [Candidatus Dependentiae bacterium]